MLEKYDLETLNWALHKIDQELAAGALDEARRAQFDRVRGALSDRISSLTTELKPVESDLPEEVSDADPDEEIEPDPAVAVIETVKNADDADPVISEDVPEIELLSDQSEPDEEDQIKAMTAWLVNQPFETPEETEVQTDQEVEDSDVAPELGEVDVRVALEARLDDLVESGMLQAARYRNTLYKRDQRRNLTEQEVELLYTQRLSRKERQRTNGTIIIRFDPELGSYDEDGKMYADPTESKTVCDNLDTIVAVASHLSDLSNGGVGSAIDQDVHALLESLGLGDANALQKRIIMREVSRILGGRAVRLVNNITEGWKVQLNWPFTFIVTELRAKSSRTQRSLPSYTEGHELEFGIVEWNETLENFTAVRESILDGKVPRPTCQQQAVKLLDAILNDNGFNNDLFERFRDDSVQVIKDLAHVFVQDQLGWNAYVHARQSRMIRSGREGFSSVVRQVTGSQDSERFQRQSLAQPDLKQ